MKWVKVTKEELELVPERYRRKSIDSTLLASKAASAMEIQNNFTVVLLKAGKFMTVGVTKRNPRDKRNIAIAYTVAFVRAYREYGGLNGKA